MVFFIFIRYQMSKKTFYAFIISFILLIAVIVLNRISFDKMRGYSNAVEHTREVIACFESISNRFKSIQIYKSYYQKNGIKDFYDRYISEVNGIELELIKLKKLIADNPEQLKLADTLTSIIHSNLRDPVQDTSQMNIDTSENDRLNDILVVHELNNKGVARENSLLAFRKSQLNDSTHHTNLLTTSFAVVAVAIIMLTFLSNMFISQRSRRLEGLLESILNTSQNAIVHYKAIKEQGKITDFYIEYANNAVKDLFYIFPEDLIGKLIKSIPNRTPMMYEKFVEIMETGTPQSFEYLYKYGNDSQWIYASLSKTADGITGTFHNITPIKKYEEELKGNIKELERSNMELEQYAYVASHDLQEPLRKIRSFGSYIQDTQASKMDEKGKEQLNKIMGAAERMSVLIKDILSYSSLTRQELLVPVDLNKILQAVIHDLDLAISQKGARIEKDLLPTIDAIPLQMNQLFYNLLNNSLKFSKPDHHTCIQIRSRVIDESEKLPDLLPKIKYYEFVFTDDGIGFSQDYAEQIFGLFKRLNDRQHYPGSGIGLALCKKVVENHNGAITAKSTEQVGTSFYIYLPERQN